MIGRACGYRRFRSPKRSRPSNVAQVVAHQRRPLSRSGTASRSDCVTASIAARSSDASIVATVGFDLLDMAMLPLLSTLRASRPFKVNGGSVWSLAGADDLADLLNRPCAEHSAAASGLHLSVALLGHPLGTCEMAFHGTASTCRLGTGPVRISKYCSMNPWIFDGAYVMVCFSELHIRRHVAGGYQTLQSIPQ
jgi:hypothetical protein